MSISAISSTSPAPVAASAGSARAKTGPATPAAAPAATPTAPVTAPITPITTSSSIQLNAEALELIDKLKSSNTEPPQHGHAAGGRADAAASYTYSAGSNASPAAGAVQIDTSPAHTPEETIARAHTIEAAALAPVIPSSADRAVAVQAEELAQQANEQLAALQAQSQAGVAAAPPAQVPAQVPQITQATVNLAYGIQSSAPPTLDTYA